MLFPELRAQVFSSNESEYDLNLFYDIDLEQRNLEH